MRGRRNMLDDNQQKTLLGIKNPEQEYLELINKEYYFRDAVQILDKIDWDFRSLCPQKFLPARLNYSNILQ